MKTTKNSAPKVNLWCGASAGQRFDTIADAVAQGHRSRASVDREFGSEVGAAVRQELARRSDASRAAVQPAADDGVVAPPGLCADCGVIEIDPDAERCERCDDWHRRHDWIEAAEAAVLDAAERHGWTVERTSVSSLGSRYYEVSRDTSDSDLESFRLRISDHADCYCTAHYSVAMRPSGDDAPLETVLTRLAQPRQ